MKSELRKQQLTVTLSDCNHLVCVIALWQIQQFICYCTVFALFYFVFEGNSKYKPQEAYIRRGDLIEGFLRYELEGFIYIWRGLFSEFYGIL